MKKALPLALVAGGAVLLFLGYQGYNSAKSQFTEVFSGRPPNDVIAMLVIGAVLVAGGLGLFGKGMKS